MRLSIQKKSAGETQKDLLRQYIYNYIYMYVYDFVTTPLGVNYIPKFQLAESV